MKSSYLINDESYDRMVYLFEEEADMKEALSKLNCNFTLLGVEDWNRDLSPYPAKAGKMTFSGNGQETLNAIRHLIATEPVTVKKRYIAGYSLAGLFALYGLGEFNGAVSCSGSLWYEGFVEWFKNQPLRVDQRIYLSLGKSEELGRNRLFSEVGERTRELYLYLQDKQIDCILEWNEGGHMNDPAGRLLKGLRWILKEEEE